MLRILILSDGRPGHFNLSEGIAAAIERLGPATTARFDVRRGRWPGGVLASMTRAPLPAHAMLKAVYGIAEAELPAADIVVSAGAETLAASVWLARARSIPNVFYGSLRRFRPIDFALVLTSYSSQASRPRHALALKPSRLDPDTLHTDARNQDPSSETRPASQSAQTPAIAALIIGGDSGTFAYQDADWDRLFAFIGQCHDRLGTRWLASNSRRTPDAVSDRLLALAKTSNTLLADLIDVRQPAARALTDLLADAQAVVCTDDSSSMISECVWARLPVIGVSPLRSHLNANEQAYRDWLAANRWAASVPIADLSPDLFTATLKRLQPLAGNPLADLSDLLAERIPTILVRAQNGRTPPT